MNNIFISLSKLGAGCLRDLVAAEILGVALGRSWPWGWALAVRGLHCR